MWGGCRPSASVDQRVRSNVGSQGFWPNLRQWAWIASAECRVWHMRQTCGKFAPPHELRLRRATTAVIPPHTVAYVEETLASSASLSQERRCDSRWCERKFVPRAWQQPMMQHTNHYAACFSHPP